MRFAPPPPNCLMSRDGEGHNRDPKVEKIACQASGLVHLCCLAVEEDLRFAMKRVSGSQIGGVKNHAATPAPRAIYSAASASRRHWAQPGRKVSRGRSITDVGCDARGVKERRRGHKGLSCVRCCTTRRMSRSISLNLHIVRRCRNGTRSWRTSPTKCRRASRPCHTWILLFYVSLNLTHALFGRLDLGCLYT